MRKINKTIILSTEYKQWEDGLEQRQKAHPKYKSSNFKYYNDVVMNLLYCQQGRCAYTEMFLCPESDYSPEHWQNGRYAKETPEFFGHLEHFDSSLKVRKAWLWSNLFMVHSDINVKSKHDDETIDDILKPDTEDYDPFRLLEYDEHTHFFIANTDLPEEEQRRITKMITVLGINYGPVRYKRSEVLNEKLSEIESGKATWNDAPHEFITSFEMCKRDRYSSAPVEGGINVSS